MKEFFRKYFLLTAVSAFMLALVFYYFARHRQPYTQNAFLVANVRPVSVLVPGYLTHVGAANNCSVRRGDELFRIYAEPYRLTVLEIEAQIRSVQSARRALEKRIAVIEAQQDEMSARSANARYQAERALFMYAGSAVSQAYTEETLRNLEALEAGVRAARAQIPVLEEEIAGKRAEEAALTHQLGRAQIDLEETSIRALTDGVILNMFVSPGGFYPAGAVLCALVDTGTWWVQANFEETDLSRIAPGQSAEIWLWQYPGKTFHGVVEADGWGVERRHWAENGAPEVQNENQWFRLPQRFPVQIRILDPDETYPFHLGGSAYVRVRTGARLWAQFWWRIWQW